MLCTTLFDAVKDFGGLVCSGSMMNVLWDAHRMDDPKEQSVLADWSGGIIHLRVLAYRHRDLKYGDGPIHFAFL